MAKNNKQCFEFDRTDRLRRTIFLEDSSEDELFEYNNKTKISNYVKCFQKLNKDCIHFFYLYIFFFIHVNLRLIIKMQY